MLLRLFPLLFICGCLPASDNIKDTIHLMHESADAINNSSEIYFSNIKENAYQYPERGRPLLQKAVRIDSLILQFNTSLDIDGSSYPKPTKAEYLDRYSTILADIQLVLQIDSYNIPEQYEFNIESSTVKLDSIKSNALPAVIQLNLALIKSDVFQLLNTLAPFSIECNFGNMVFVVDDIIKNNEVQFDLTSKAFSQFEKRYITFDSAYRSNKALVLDASIIEQSTFARISMDSLLPGTYKIYGKVSSFPNDVEVTQNFSHEFVIDNVRK